MQAIDFAYIVKATSPQGSSDCSCNSGHGTPAALGGMATASATAFLLHSCDSIPRGSLLHEEATNDSLEEC